MSLEEWKTKAITTINKIINKLEDETTKLYLMALATRIEQARIETLYYVVKDIHLLSSKIPELKQIIPNADELENW